MSKHIDRLNAIKEIVDQAGKIDAITLKNRLCKRLSIDEDSLKKATFYRSITECVDKGWIREEVDGKQKYLLSNKSNSVILGQSLLESAGAKIFVSDTLKDQNVVSVFTSESQMHENHSTCLYFQITNTLFILRIQNSVLPVKILISRKTELSNEKNFALMENEFGSNLISLQVPVSSISSFNGENKRGHCLFELNQNDLKIQDLASVNKNYISVINSDLFKNIKQFGANIGAKTTNSAWDSYLEKELEFKVVNGASLLNSKNYVVQCSEGFRIVI